MFCDLREHCRVIFFVKHTGTIANDDSVTTHFFPHVSGVTWAIKSNQQTTITQPAVEHQIMQ